MTNTWIGYARNAHAALLAEQEKRYMTQYLTGSILVANRPYVITFHATGQQYPLSAEEVRRCLGSEVLCPGSGGARHSST